MKEIQIAFYKGLSSPTADWQDKIICWWTKGPYSHVELIIDGYMYSTSPRDKKVRVKPHKFDENKWEYVILNINDDKIDEFKAFFEQTKGLPYDWAGILGFVIPLADKEKKYFCSEWVTKALIIMNMRKLYKIEPSKTSPNRLYKLLTEK